MHPDVISALAAAHRADVRAAVRAPHRVAAPAAPSRLRRRTGWLLVTVGLRLAVAPRPAARPASSALR
jgi:hypothetical protein